MPPKKKSTSAYSCRTLLIIFAGGALLVTWLRFTSSISEGSGGRIMTVAQHDRAVAAAAPVVASAELADSAIAQPAAAAAPVKFVRQHELHVRVAAPAPLKPLLSAEPAVDAPEQCNARAHTEYEGGVVTWGSNNKVESAAACCESCRASAAKARPDGKACNIWVYCADKDLCGERLGQCWLKHTLNPADPPSRGSGPSVPWTSGAVLPQPASAYRLATRMKRANRQRADLTVLEASGLSVGLRNETGTIELLTPTGNDQPHFSFPLPLTDVDVRLGGRGEFLDRTTDGFHHLGDLTLRATPRGGNEAMCTSVAHGQVSASAAVSASIAGSVAGGTLAMGATGGEPLWSHSRDIGLQQVRNRQRSGACPLSVTRRIVAHSEAHGGGVDMIFDVLNPIRPSGGGSVALDALGLSMPFDQDFVGCVSPRSGGLKPAAQTRGYPPGCGCSCPCPVLATTLCSLRSLSSCARFLPALAFFLRSLLSRR